MWHLQSSTTWSDGNYMLLVDETRNVETFKLLNLSTTIAMIKLSLKEESEVKVNDLDFFCLPKLTSQETFFSKISESLIFNAHQQSCGN